MQIRNLKQALNLGQVIKFSHKAWLKSSTDINTELRKN